MSVEITVPRLGWSMDEGVFVGWLKKEGDWVKPGEILFELEGEKAIQEIEALDEGVLTLLADGPKPGDVVKVGQAIGVLAGKDGVVAPPRPTVGQSTGQPKPSASVSPVTAKTPRTVEAAPAASPRARRVSRELGVDWRTVQGSGRGGRIRERDVRAAASTASPARKAPIDGVRRTIANRMLASSQQTAPVTLTSKADATNLVGLRRQFQSLDASNVNAVPSITDLIVKLTALALSRHPRLNATWEEGAVREIADIHVAVAVDTDRGLLAPVIRDAGTLGIRSIAARSRELIDRARRGELAASDLAGGTFTVSNLGQMGIDAFTPIINLPEAAILGVGAIRREAAVVADDRIEPRDVMTLSLTFDHRVVDGAPAARFLQSLVAAIENPAPWLIE